MADDVRVEVDGYLQLAADTGRLAKKIGERATDDFVAVADRKAAAARTRVPHRSGALAASVAGGEGDERALVGMGGSAVPYAGWVEFGGTRGRPYVGSGRYLYPTALDAEPLLLIAADQAARKEIGTMVWSSPTP